VLGSVAAENDAASLRRSIMGGLPSSRSCTARYAGSRKGGFCPEPAQQPRTGPRHAAADVVRSDGLRTRRPAALVAAASPL